MTQPNLAPGLPTNTQPDDPATYSGFESYKSWSIVSLLFLCWPLGIAALILSLNAETAWNQGDHVMAADKAQMARLLNTISSILFGTTIVLLIIVSMLSSTK